MIDSAKKSVTDMQQAKIKMMGQSKNIKSLADLQTMMEGLNKSVNNFANTAKKSTQYESKKYMLSGIDHANSSHKCNTYAF